MRRAISIFVILAALVGLVSGVGAAALGSEWVLCVTPRFTGAVSITHALSEADSAFSVGETSCDRDADQAKASGAVLLPTPVVAVHASDGVFGVSSSPLTATSTPAPIRVAPASRLPSATTTQRISEVNQRNLVASQATPTATPHQPPTTTPTATPQQSPTPRPTPSSTPTPTATITQVQTSTPTATPTATSTPSATTTTKPSATYPTPHSSPAKPSPTECARPTAHKPLTGPTPSPSPSRETPGRPR